MKVEHLIMYLPHQVKVKIKGKIKEHAIGTVSAVYSDGSIVCYDTVNATPSKFKLLLYPKSDAYEIVVKGKKMDFLQAVDIHSFSINELPVDQLNLKTLNLLLKHHIDVFGYIDKKQAIDINTLNLEA